MIMYASYFLVLSEIRKQRKMGHITIVGPSKVAVKSRLDKLLQRDTQEPNKGTTFIIEPRTCSNYCPSTQQIILSNQII
jgi:hypothetical protein